MNIGKRDGHFIVNGMEKAMAIEKCVFNFVTRQERENTKSLPQSVDKKIMNKNWSFEIFVEN